jgi:hypothetical protein
MNRETKQESSIPAQCRVSIVTLASLAKYWKTNGYNISTVSQLMSWSLYLLTEILESNRQIGREPSIEEAREYMMNEGLYQKVTGDRGYKKLNAAIRFQGMREEGINPANSSIKEDRNVSHMLHRAPNKFTGKPSSVEPFMGRVSSPLVTQDAIDIYDNLQPEDIKPHVSKEFAMKDVELAPLHQGASSEDINERIQSNDEIANAQLGALNSLDLSTLKPMSEKEKIVK